MGIAGFHHRLPRFRRDRTIREALVAVGLSLHVRDRQRDRLALPVCGIVAARLAGDIGCDLVGSLSSVRFGQPRSHQVPLNALLNFGFAVGSR